jgi:hypothetical protein
MFFVWRGVFALSDLLHLPIQPKKGSKKKGSKKGSKKKGSKTKAAVSGGAGVRASA